MKLLGIALFFLAPVFAGAVTVQDIRKELGSYQGLIDSFQADFTITIDGAPSNAASRQAGVFSFNGATGTVLRYSQPMALTMEIRTNGSVYMNGTKSRSVSSSYQMGDIFFVYFLENFDLSILSENSNAVLLAGYKPQPAGKSADPRLMLRMRYNKTLRVIDFIQYLGDGQDYPYELSADYAPVQGIPVLKALDMRLAAFSVNMRSRMKLENVVLNKKER